MRESRTAIGLAAVLLVIAACGDGDSEGTGGAGSEETTGLDVVVEALQVYESGDIEAWQALWALDATWEQTTTGGVNYSGTYFEGSDGVFDYGRRGVATEDWDGDGEITISDIEARSQAEFSASGGRWQAACELDDSATVTCRVTPTTVFGTWAFANIQMIDRSGATTGTVTITVRDGLISHHAAVFASVEQSVVTAYQDAQRDYWAWIRESSSEADTLIGTSMGQLVFTPDNYQQHRDLIAEWSVQG